MPLPDFATLQPVEPKPVLPDFDSLKPVTGTPRFDTSQVKLDPQQAAQMQAGTPDLSTESFESWLPRQKPIPEETLRPLTGWERFKQSAQINLEKVFPGMAEKGSPAPTEVVGQTAMLLPVGMPERLGKLVYAYFAARTALDQPAIFSAIKDELQRGDYT